MKTPIDVVEGKIITISPDGSVLIEAHYDDIYTMIKRRYYKCKIQMIDSRPLSDKQRRACYALLREISDFTGNGVDSTKEYMKLKFLAEDFGETAEQIFSLANAPMSLVCAFQRFLVRFILDWDIPTRFPLLDLVDDIPDYIYACLINKKCCISGKRAQLHHVDQVGMGRDRDEIIHEGMQVLPLSAELHEEAHMLGKESFLEKYHLPGGVVMDETLCRIYKLKRRGDRRGTQEKDG